jgi:polyisoprenoid-binding protein YceI
MKLASKLLVVSAIAAALLGSARAAVETYAIDPVHSSVAFSIRHFVSHVPGSFTKFSGTISVDRTNLENSTVEATVELASINTSNEKRDNHVRSADFFNVEKNPTTTFKSTSWKKTGEDTYDVTGDLTLNNVTKPVVLHTTLLGFGPGMQGAQLSGWEAKTTIKRSDFGVNGPAMLSKALGDDVALTISVEADLKK